MAAVQAFFVALVVAAVAVVALGVSVYTYNQTHIPMNLAALYLWGMIVVGSMFVLTGADEGVAGRFIGLLLLAAAWMSSNYLLYLARVWHIEVDTSGWLYALQLPNTVVTAVSDFFSALFSALFGAGNPVSAFLTGISSALTATGGAIPGALGSIGSWTGGFLGAILLGVISNLITVLVTRAVLDSGT